MGVQMSRWWELVYNWKSAKWPCIGHFCYKWLFSEIQMLSMAATYLVDPATYSFRMDFVSLNMQVAWFGDGSDIMKTILVVEDFVAVQQFLRETLESKGYKTLGATNGNRAYEVLVNHAHQTNLVLTDYHMPESNGYDLVKKIKANPDLEKVPVIFLTAETNPDIINGVVEMGYIHIKKPYRAEVLLKAVEKAIAQSNH